MQKKRIVLTENFDLANRELIRRNLDLKHKKWQF